MKLDLRILVAVVVFATLGIGTSLGLRALEHHVSNNELSSENLTIEERIPPDLAPTAELVNEGADISLTRSSFRMVIKGCKAEPFYGTYFLHTYKNPNSNPGDRFTNLDFNITKDQMKKMAGSPTNDCYIDRKFENQTVRRVTFGRFEMPDGKCCTIIWSRMYTIK